MKVLITGASGFLGGALTRRLIAEGHDVHILVRPTADLTDLEDLRPTIVHGDVTDPESLARAFSGCDSVFHLAGVIAYRRSERALMEKVNVTGTYNVVRAARQCQIRRLVHLSSVVAVGAGFTRDQVLDETSPYNVGHLHLGYFDTKHAAERVVRDAVHRNEIDAVILNPSTIYGPADSRKSSRSTQLKVARGQFPFYTSGGVSVVHVDDVLYGIVTAWQRGTNGERYILSGDNVSIKDLFTMIAAAAGVPAPRRHLPDWAVFAAGRTGDLLSRFGFQKGPSVENAWTATLYHWFRHDKATRELGFRPRPAADAIAASVDWARQHGYLSGAP